MHITKECSEMSKPWHTSDWKKKRKELIKNKKCEWCGSKENLVIHHLKQNIRLLMNNVSLLKEQSSCVRDVTLLCTRGLSSVKFARRIITQRT